MISAVFAGLLALMATLWTSGAVAVWARPRLQAYLSQKAHGQLHIGTLSLGLVPPAITAADISFTPIGALAPSITLRTARLQLDPWPSSSGVPVIEVLEMAGLHAELYYDLLSAFFAGPMPQNQPPSKAWRLPVDIRNFVLHNSSVTWRTGGRFVRLDEINAELYASARLGRTLWASVGKGEVLWPGPLQNAPIEFQAHLEAELVGPLDRLQRIGLSRSHLQIPGARVNASGWVDLASGQDGLRAAPKTKIQATALAQLDELSELVSVLPHLGGRSHIDVLIQGLLQDPSVDVELSCERLVVGPRHIGEVQLEAAGTRRGLTIESLRLFDPDGGSATGSGRLNLEPPYNLEMTARLQNAALPAILESAGLQNPWIRMHLLGDVQGVGTLQPFHLSLVTDVDVKDFQILDRGFHDPLARAVLHIPNGSLRGTAEVQSTQTRIEAVEVASGNSQLTVGGIVPYSTKHALNLKVAATGFELADLGRIANIPFRGLGGFEASIAGPYNHLDISCQLTAADFAVYDYQLGDTEASLRYRPPVLSIESIEAVRRQGRFGGAGKLVFGRPQVHTEGVFDAESLDLADLFVDLGLSPQFARHFGAAVSGRLAIKGPLKHLAGTANLRAPHLRVDGVLLGAMALEGSFGQPPSRLWGTLTLKPDHPQAGNLICHSEWFDNDTLALSGDLQRIPLTLLTPFVSDAPITGMLSAQGALRGPLDDLVGQLVVDVDQTKAWGLQLGHVHLDGQADDGQLHIDGHLADNKVQLGARLGLLKPQNFVGEARFLDLDVQTLWADFKRRTDIDVRASGHVRAQGALRSFGQITANAQLSHLSLNFGQTSIVNEAPVVLSWAHRHLTLAPAALSAPGMAVHVAGVLPAGGDMDVRLNIAGDLSVVRTITPELAQAQGPYSLRIALSGQLDEPELNGEAEIRQGSLRLVTSEQPLERLSMRALFTGRSIALQNGSAQLGGGMLRFSGEAQLGSPKSPVGQMNMHMTLQQVGLKLYPELDMTLSGSLDLGGSFDTLRLDGNLKVDALRYTARIDIDKLLPKRGAPPIKAPLVALGHPLRLNIKLHGPNNLIISSSMLEAELQAELTLTGTAERVGLLGNVTPLWARAHYRDNVFKLTRASVDFVDEYRIFPEFLLQAHTQACNLQADVTIQGNADTYTLTPFGQDEHGAVDPQDVLACLQFGLRLRDFDGNQKGSAGIGDALPGGLDALWAVSGLDDKVRKLLPINVDEIRLTSGWSSLSQRTTARVLVGKELNGHIAMKYSRSLDEYNDQAFSLEYTLNPRLTLQGTWLTALDVPMGDFGVDLRLHWELR